MSNEREQLIARLRRFAVVLEARGETYDAETCEQAIASLSAPVAEPPLYTIGRGSDGRVTVTTTPAPDALDAQRYRFAKTMEGQILVIDVFRNHGADALDAAIDAAMKEQP